ncbi:MAG: hypothetical protein LBB15_02090 [Puniceicoccales bacterium]|jgi:hypothetical protein|nr:hypothetical protein [Puniceicoccales bacterium]
MHLPSKTKLFFLVAVSFSLAALLPVFSSTNLPKINLDEGPFTRIDVKSIKNIEVLRESDGGSILLISTLSDKWMCNLDGMKMLANQHAVGELLLILEALKFYTNGHIESDSKNFSWMVTLTNRTGDASRLKIAETHVYYNDGNTTYSIENNEIGKRMAKIYPELYCKHLLDEANLELVSRVKFSLNGINFDFAKLGDCFIMASPIYRQLKGSFVGDVLHDVSTLYCSSISKEHPADTHLPLFTFEFKCGRIIRLIEFYESSSGFYAKKFNVVNKFDSRMSNTVGAIHAKLETFRIFSGLKCNAIDVSNFLENRYLFFRKLENSKQWQKSYKFGGKAVLIDIEGDEIRQLENTISGFNCPIDFNPVEHMCIAKLSLQSNIGELTFDIFRDLDGYIFLNSESSLAFAVGSELTGVLHLLLNYQSQ